jgi:hypothetical protein
MTRLTNRSNVRTSLKLDDKKKIWSDDTIDRYINEGQRWMQNSANMNWSFAETMGYFVPVQGYQEFRTSSDDNPETYFSTLIREIIKAKSSTGNELSFGRLPVYTQATSTAPSMLTEYSQKYFLNAGYTDAATYTTLHAMDTYDGNGTWAGTNDATTVATDTTTYKEGTGSVSYSIDVSNSTSNKATLTNSTLTGVDISSNEINNGAIVLWTYLTDADDIRSIEVKFGSDSSNYYAVRGFQDVQGIKYQDGWNRILIPTLSKQTVGTPDLSSVDYLQVNTEFDSGEADQASCRIDSIQYVDKYIQYYYTRKSSNMTSDSDESIIPSDYQYIYEIYAEYKCWRSIGGKEQLANLKFSEAKQGLNNMIDELSYNYPQEYLMPPKK